MIPETSEAEEIFSNTFANSIRKFSAIFSFWRISRLGVPNVYTTIFNEAKDFNKDLFTNIVNAKFFHDQQAAFEFLEPLGGIEGCSSSARSSNTPSLTLSEWPNSNGTQLWSTLMQSFHIETFYGPPCYYKNYSLP